MHDNEYVIPEFVRKDPEVPQIIEYLENKRINKIKGFETGGDSNSEASDVPILADSKATDKMTLEVLSRLSDQISAGIVAKTFYDYEDEIARQEVQDKIENTQTAANN